MSEKVWVGISKEAFTDCIAAKDVTVHDDPMLGVNDPAWSSF